MLSLTWVVLLTIGAVYGNDPEKGCGNNPADIVFVLDESGSIWGPHFTKQLEFVESIISSFDVGFNRTHIGVLCFGTSERIIFPLGKYTDEQELKVAVRAIKQRRGDTYTHLALKRTRQEMFSPIYSRPWVRHVAIVITDGESNYPEETKKEARLCHQENIQMFAIGVGQAVAKNELEAIASSEDLVFMVDSYAALESLRQILAWKTCETTSTRPPSTTTTTAAPEPPPQMIEDCSGHKKIDIVWAISELSGVIESKYALSFIKKVTEDMKIDRDFVQVGLAPTICHERAEIRLKDHDTKEGFWNDLDNKQLTGLYTDKTIEYLRLNGTRSANGARSDAVKFGILIVDFEAENWERTLRQAVLAKNEGIRLIVIGVGDNIREDRLRELASYDNYYFHARSYSHLDDLDSDIINRLCEGISDAGPEPMRRFLEDFYLE